MDNEAIFTQNGYIVFNDLLSSSEWKQIDSIYNAILTNTIDLSENRSDLSGKGRGINAVEKITQIMRPSDKIPFFKTSKLLKECTQLSKKLLGADMALDFDMLINKAPHTNTPTPWHQDEAYWPTMPDKRALSFWIAIDDATKENGCMWYAPKSHLQPQLEKHVQLPNGGALCCQWSEEEALCIPIAKKSAVAHHGRTLHYSRGNSTSGNRRAYILNFRPQAMIDLERSLGFDHTGKRSVQS